jgi:hypothetical protein
VAGDEVRPRKDKRGVDLISDALESFLIAGRQNDAASMTSTISAHIYEVRPRKMMNSRSINLV